jgi:hypothetical protein
MCDGRLCPLLAGYDVADALLDELGDLHESPDLARAQIAVYRRSMEIIRKRSPCDGPVADHDNEVTCPIAPVGNVALRLATGPPTRIGWAFDPEKVLGARVAGSAASSAGQYL